MKDVLHNLSQDRRSGAFKMSIKWTGKIPAGSVQILTEETYVTPAGESERFNNCGEYSDVNNVRHAVVTATHWLAYIDAFRSYLVADTSCDFYVTWGMNGIISSILISRGATLKRNNFIFQSPVVVMLT